ncbi:uncharacterized protein AB9W97_010538 isoform 2-T6 [Spinachia spinachia]
MPGKMPAFNRSILSGGRMDSDILVVPCDAHPWLRAHCQQTSREQQKRFSGPRDSLNRNSKQLASQRDETVLVFQRDELLPHQARDSQASQLDVQEQGSLSCCLNCRRVVWISGGTESHAAKPKAASEPDSAGPGAPESDVASSGGSASAARRDPHRSQQQITARDQRVTKLDQHLTDRCTLKPCIHTITHDDNQHVIRAETCG